MNYKIALFIFTGILLLIMIFINKCF